MRRIVSGELWETFAAQPLLACDFLEARLAPLGDDGRLVYLRNLGTDLQRFTALFDRFHLVRGTEVPPGQRGFLFSQRIYEKIIKNRVARALDALQEDLTESGLHIATDAHSRDLAARLPRQYQRITFAVLPEKRQQAQAALRRHLPHAPPQATFEELVQEFLRVDDANFAERYRAFYADIAPCIRLYAVNVGDNLTLRSFTKSGYLKSVNVKVYGTFEFRGLQRTCWTCRRSATCMGLWAQPTELSWTTSSRWWGPPMCGARTPRACCLRRPRRMRSGTATPGSMSLRTYQTARSCATPHP
jgi:hypothetical protein